MGRDQGVGTRHSKPNAGGSPPLLSLQFLEVPPVLSWWGQGPHDCAPLAQASGFPTVAVLPSLPSLLDTAQR